MNNEQILAQLRDIHAPQTLSWWPLAPGWFVMAILGLIFFIGFIYLYKKHQQKVHRRQTTLQHLQRLRHLDEEHYPLVYQELSTLLRRIALLTHARAQVAHLTGEEWLKFLDTQCHTQVFSQDIGRLLLSAPYFPGNKPLASPMPLLDVTEAWIKQCI